eukprot:GHVN01006228.1.p1 GENE.GHVN01006228.1~~GHVN01006228.1.p1  ORF type:complete len:119 (-),score=21.33 GHVN01006228.1:452-808(-)
MAIHHSASLYHPESSFPFSTPSHHSLQIESSRLTALEKRLSDLENHIGVGMRRPGTTPFADLSSGLNEIALRLVELDSTRLDVLSQRMMVRYKFIAQSHSTYSSHSRSCAARLLTRLL